MGRSRDGAATGPRRPPRVLLAADKFKGTLTSAEVARHVAVGLRRTVPEVRVRSVPVADGGEGTVEAALTAGFERREAAVRGPLGETVRALWAMRDGTAVVELAQASGLGLLPSGERAPLRADTYGTGELLRAALDERPRRIVLGVGGSASTDAGTGMLTALGARFLDSGGGELAPGGGGLSRLAAADLSTIDPRLAGTEVILACDVTNPLTGPEGAAAVYGPQKGASPAEVRQLDAALDRCANVVSARLGPAAAGSAGLPGAGAAGGVGWAALAVLGARMRPGIEELLELCGFGAALAETDLVITGEGSLDAQTLRGKAPAGVARAAREAGRPVVAVCGRCELAAADLARIGIGHAYALTDTEPDLGRCHRFAGPLLEALAARLAHEHLLEPARAQGAGRTAP